MFRESPFRYFARLVFLGTEGIFLNPTSSHFSYAIIRHNIRTYRSGGVLVVVKGKQNAETELKAFEDSQDSSDRHEGWRYFIEKTDLAPGTDPATATQHRQSELDARESKALRETNNSNFPSPDLEDSDR
ncbi:MAG TPA: hypothetical protein VKV39_18530 [Candidatus Sulfotelmatobacter sp.]|nr:hypothetical protein [Candidatus Sulfotelmatobacter sp.]